MTNPETTKRRYVRLSPDQWAEIEAAWSSGATTLPELAHRFGATERAIQAHLNKRGLEKGSAAKALAAQVVARVRAEQEVRADSLTERALAISEGTYSAAERIEMMMLDALDAAAADPAQTFIAAARVKMLGNAAAALERLHTLKRSALGINDDDMKSTELPTFVVRNLTQEEIDRMRHAHDEEDALSGDVIDMGFDHEEQDDDDVIREGADNV